MQLRELPDALMARGRHTATTQELLELTGLDPAALHIGLHRLRQGGSIVSPARGLYAVVPAQYRAWGSPPAEWFIDAMMEQLDRSYYIALLTAAAMHGAAHQAPQVFQVITDKHVSDRELGRNRIRFYTSRYIAQTPTELRPGPSGYLRLATRETTAVDITQHPRQSSGLSNVATVLVELGELDGAVLARVAAPRGKAVARRLGWLLESYRPDVSLDALREAASPEQGAPTLLSASGPARGRLDRGWDIRINTDVQPDL
ncbi:MAG TPA: type IV toxin-antitoxin system AbiEi family antitoxin [Solirubrobacteraceae bacterium]|nr:type IV toxin-antitoxin system AbiEi family antitoxin [Solirubrobacteraceae bacterium]